MAVPGLAIQLYTLRSLTAENMVGTLTQLAGFGYKAVELAGYGNASVADLAKALQVNNIEAISAHVPLDRMEGEIETVFDEMRALSCPEIVVPWLKPERRAPELVADLAASLDAIGAKCVDAGFRFSYHNHDFEFSPVGDGDLFDYLLAHTDPANVNFELDLYWAEFAGVDSVELIEKFKGRCPLVHVKDMAGDAKRDDTVFGEGVIQWGLILPAAINAGAEWFIIEQDNPVDALHSAKAGLANLKAVLA